MTTASWRERAEARIHYEPTTGCWLWAGVTTRDGYGWMWVDGRRGAKRSGRVHRLMFEAEHGPIPEGLVLDHLCRNPACCNPEHLEAVTDRVNILRGNAPAAVNARKTHCIRGHAFGPESAGQSGRGGRRRRTCRICQKASKDRYAERRRAIYPLPPRARPKA